MLTALRNQNLFNMRNYFIVSSLAFVVMTTLCIGSVYGQQQFERKGVVEKEALIVYMVGGQNVLATAEPTSTESIDEQGNVIKRFSVGSVEDYFNYHMIPNDKKLPNGQPIPIEVHFRDFVNNHPYIYMFNDVYLSSSIANGSQNEFYRSIGYDSMGVESEPQIDMEKLKASNDVFISYKNSYVGKFWVLKGEWEEYEVREKPTVLRGVTPLTLQYDHYNVYLLKKITSIEPVTRVADIPGHIEAVSGQVPNTKPRN